MSQKVRKIRRQSGVTLTEVMAATTILILAVIGASGYRYCSSLNAHWSQEQITAARIGQLLCGSWAGVKGVETFDLKASLGSDLAIETLDISTSLPQAFLLLGRYRITIEGTDYDCTMAWNKVSPDLRALWIRVEWDLRKEDPTKPDSSLKKSFTVITDVSG